MIDGWQSGRFATYPKLPDWQGLPWSFLLTPGWRELSGLPLGEIVARQWDCTTRILLDDLEALPAERRIAIDYGRFLADPQGQIARLCEWAGFGWDKPLGKQLPHSRSTTSTPDPEKWRRHARRDRAAAAGVAGDGRARGGNAGLGSRGRWAMRCALHAE